MPGKNIVGGCGAIKFYDEVASIAATVNYTNDATIQGFEFFGGAPFSATSHQELFANGFWDQNSIAACKGAVGFPGVPLPEFHLCSRRNCCTFWNIFTSSSTTIGGSTGSTAGDHSTEVCVFAPSHTVTGDVGFDMSIVQAPGPPITLDTDGFIFNVVLVVLNNDFNEDGGFTCQFCGGISRFTSSWRSPVFSFGPIPYLTVFGTHNFSISESDPLNPPASPPGSDCGYSSQMDVTVTVTRKP